jgi:hypothetical protein
MLPEKFIGIFGMRGHKGIAILSQDTVKSLGSVVSMLEDLERRRIPLELVFTFQNKNEIISDMKKLKESILYVALPETLTEEFENLLGKDFTLGDCPFKQIAGMKKNLENFFIEATEKKDSDIVCVKKSNKEDKEKNFSVGESMLRFLMEKFLYNEVIDEQLKGRSKNQTMKSFGATDDMTIEELAKQIIESSFEEL